MKVATDAGAHLQALPSSVTMKLNFVTQPLLAVLASLQMWPPAGVPVSPVDTLTSVAQPLLAVHNRETQHHTQERY